MRRPVLPLLWTRVGPSIVAGALRGSVRAGLVATLVLLVAACDTGQVANLSIRSPSPGDSFTRDTIGVFGGRVAVVEVDVFSSGLAVTELLVEGRDVSDNRGSAEVDISGDVTLLVRGLDESGEVVASDSVTIVVADPPLAQCTQWLDLFGVDYQAGPAAPGIANPITASTPIAGVDYSLGGAPAAQIHADCTLIRSLAESAGAMRRRGVTEVQAAAIYDEGNEGQHALGTAIDVSGYVRDGGEPVSVATDWVLDLEGQSTCGAPTDSDADAWLHDVICAVRETGLWTVALSPNYDPDLAGLFHFDLTGGERNAVDTGPNNH